MRVDAAPDRRSLRFSKRSLATTYAIVAVAWLTGVAWLLLHHFARRQGELGATPHPLEPWMVKLHGAGAFASVWLAGVLWSSHILPAWRRMTRPASGLILAGLLGALIVTGYLLYYLGDETLRGRIALAHWLIGLPLPLLLIAHVLLRRASSPPHQHGEDRELDRSD